MYKNILCATDLSSQSEKVFKKAFSYAKEFNANLFIINAQEDINSHEEMLMSRVSVSKRITENEEIAVNARKKAKEIVDTLDTSYKYKIIIREGNAEHAILEFANANDVDLIIMGTNGTDHLSDYFLGTTASHVIKTSNCPVLVVPIN
jgi:nucleotide-binding universal stress UspA family protein